MATELIGVAEAARRLGASRRDITKLLYDGAMRDDLVPLVAGRRVIPADLLPQIRGLLLKKGCHVAPEQAAPHG